MNFKFEKLIIWQTAMEYGETINEITKIFPKDEAFYLSSQLRRAADTIALNIAEGNIIQSNPDQIRFAGYSIRMVAEVITCLYKAKNRGYIGAEIFETTYTSGYKLTRMLIAFKKKLVDINRNAKTQTEEFEQTEDENVEQQD